MKATPDFDIRRRGAWIQTYSGGQFWPGDPRAVDVNITDIAHALSLKCRFNGHCDRFYSVAEHCVHVSRHLPPERALEGLLHDAAEAYLADVPRPVKPLIAEWHGIEARVHQAIAARFGIPARHSDEVRAIDAALLATEARQLLAWPPPAPWAKLPEPLALDLPCWQPIDARREFLRRWTELACAASRPGRPERGRRP